MTAVAPDLDTIAHLDFEPPCGMWRCRLDPNAATHIMRVQMPACGCHSHYLICQPCIDHFIAQVADRPVCCAKHEQTTYRWRDVVTFTPLNPAASDA